MKLTTTMAWLAAALLVGASIPGCGGDTAKKSDSATGGGGGAAGSDTSGTSSGGSSADSSVGGTSGDSTTTPADANCTAEEEAQTPTLFEPDNSMIQYMGRIDFTNPKAPVFSAGGVTISAKFRGSSVTVHLKDQTNYNYYDVLIDGTRVVNTTKFASFSIDLVGGKTAYPITVAGGCKDHTITLVKRTEAAIGNTVFQGFEVAKLLPLDPLSTRRIEVIGDSITAGAGVEGENGNVNECPNGGSDWGLATNARLAWGTLVAQTLNAQVNTAGVSGIGLTRNYSSQYDARPMPEVYDNLYLESKTSPVWDTTKYVPDALLIALGTNDFSPGDSPASAPRPIMTVDTFSTAYIAFIDTLHGYYPNAKIFVVGSPMLGDGWPDATYASRTDHITALQAVASHYANTAPSVTYVPVTHLSGLGCGTHPNPEQQAYNAKEIAKVVKTTMGW